MKYSWASKLAGKKKERKIKALGKTEFELCQIPNI